MILNIDLPVAKICWNGLYYSNAVIYKIEITQTLTHINYNSQWLFSTSPFSWVNI